MTKKLLTAAGLALVLAACDNGAAVKSATADMALPDGVSFVESVSKKGDEIVIPYKKFTLDNGLTVVLHEDKSDPLVHVDVTVHVGSGREDPGKSGFAHFFEHMLFQGSANVADEQHFALITESGGTLNGSTNTDRTNYYETVPSNQLEKMLWLEADRMGYFLDAVTTEKFEVQRETVKNERGQRVDNAPYGLLGERVGEAMFPEGHPYSWSVIGYLEDLDRADLNDLKKFFLRWYGPNNATLTIGGDIDEAQTLEWVEKYFGPIPAGPEVEAPVYTPVTLDADRYISLEDNVWRGQQFTRITQMKRRWMCLCPFLGKAKHHYSTRISTKKVMRFSPMQDMGAVNSAVRLRFWPYQIRQKESHWLTLKPLCADRSKNLKHAALKMMI